MRRRSSLRVIALASGTVGLASMFGTQACAAGTAYTWAVHTGGTQSWATAANWNPGTGTPSAIGDTANFNVSLSAPLVVQVPAATTVGTLILGDTSGNSRSETLAVLGSTLTLDNGGAGAAIVATSINFITCNVVANDDVTINTHSGGIRFNSSSTTFNASGHTVTVNESGSSNALTFDAVASAKLWIVTSGASVSASGDDNANHTMVGDIILNAGSKLQTSAISPYGLNNLVTMNGNAFWNMGPTYQTNSFGALVGNSSTWGNAAATVVLNGGTDAITTPDYSGALNDGTTTLSGGTQRLSGATNNRTGTFYVTGGILQCNKTPGPGVYAISGAGVTSSTYGGYTNILGALYVSGSGQVQLMKADQIDPTFPVDIETGGNVQLVTGSGTQHIIGGLIIDAASSFDVNTEKLILSGTTTPSATAVAYLKTGYAGGLWNGAGVNTSAATPHLGLGYTVDGLDNTTIKFTLYGDTNLDGSINFADLLTLAQNYNSTSGTWSTGDFNYDNTVNFADLLALAQNYNGSIAGPTAGLSPSFLADWNLAQSEVSTVPEPASLGLFTVGAMGLLGRRRHRHK